MLFGLTRIALQVNVIEIIIQIFTACRVVFRHIPSCPHAGSFFD
jgi:hypothetical protein